MPSDPIPLCCLLRHPTTPTEFSGDWIQRDQPAAAAVGMEVLPVFTAPCSELSLMHDKSVSVSLFPSSAFCLLHLFSLCWEQLMSPHAAERAG